MHTQSHERIIYAFDQSTLDAEDRKLLRHLRGNVGGLKIGLEAITAGIHQELRDIALGEGLFVMEDWKLADTPNTVGRAVANISKHRPWGITVKADTGESVDTAVENRGESLIIGVTVLTSMSLSTSQFIFGDQPTVMAIRLAKMLTQSKTQAVVSSPLEARDLRKVIGAEMIIITPGIRFPDSPADDQRCTATPYDAIRMGADYLVVGRPLKNAPDFVRASASIADDIARAWADRSA